MKTYKRLAVAFTGPSNSGKTTLIINLSNLLQEQGFKVAIVKHDPADKGIFDKEGKDSWKFSNTGASVVVTSPTRTTLFKQESSSMNQIISLLEDFDYLLVEGLKTLPLPRICVTRNQINYDYFEVSDTLAVDETINKNEIPNNMNILNLNNIDEILNWINTNSQKV
jgi:molybdopterin-guanine dinucleotide biosynthesis protein B